MEGQKIISSKNEERYSDRYEDLGYDVRTIGWGSWEQQKIRFVQTLSSGVSLEGKRVLDVGCGFGDYFGYLSKSQVGIDKYTGWDLSDKLIGEAKDRYGGNDEAAFRVQDLFEVKPEPVADVAVMLGLLNLKYEEVDNYEYSQKAIQQAFGLVREGLLVDFLSIHRTESYPKEDFVFYHDPSKMMDYALSLTNNVRLLHDYDPIPQKEFMLVLRK
jgi:SAM-dependent methyltransferase